MAQEVRAVIWGYMAQEVRAVIWGEMAQEVEQSSGVIWRRR